MFHDDHNRILSLPVRIFWDGWESDTYRLQQHGWEFSAEQHVYDMTVSLIMRNAHHRMYAMTNRVRINFFEFARDSRVLTDVGFQVCHMASNFNIEIVQSTHFPHKPVDMRPQFVDNPRRSIEDFEIFATPLVRTKEIILPEASVGELLAQILKRQDPARKEHYQKRVRDAHTPGSLTTPVARQNFHAQIISFPEAA